jgi:hypothetical protein
MKLTQVFTFAISCILHFIISGIEILDTVGWIQDTTPIEVDNFILILYSNIFDKNLKHKILTD